MTLPPLERLEVSSGMVFGRRRTQASEPLEKLTGGPRETLEQILLDPLRRPPCLVAFSGGRDSSAILAEATRVARSHGLEDPVPHTLRFGNAPRTDEEEWQEMVIRHLGLQDWRKQAIGEELDALGPLGRSVIARQGVHWPPNAHTFQIWLDAAAGGSLLTGNGGDELFHPFAGHRVHLLKRGRTRPRRRDLRPVMRWALPDWLLVQWVRRRSWLSLPWLVPSAAREVERSFAVNSMRIRRSWAEDIDDYLESRYIELATGFTAALARDADVNLVEPFFDARYVRSVCVDSPPEGHPSRTAAMKRYFGDLLPPEVASRSTKAVFTEVFCGPETRRFAEEWDGAGVDPAYIDAGALREQWLSPVPDVRSLVPLQAAWSASR